jgi:hypothetical protein
MKFPDLPFSHLARCWRRHSSNVVKSCAPHVEAPLMRLRRREHAAHQTPLDDDGALVPIDVRLQWDLPRRAFDWASPWRVSLAMAATRRSCADGRRFLINTGSGASALPVTVTVNLPGALRR